MRRAKIFRVDYNIETEVCNEWSTKMKVILLEDVPRVGMAGEVKEVADGYGRNYLLPKGLAEFASPVGLKKAEERQRVEERRQVALNVEMQGLAETLSGLVITISAKAGEQDRLYGSVTSADIAAEAQNVAGHEIDKRKVELEEPIHHLGEYDVPVKLSRDLIPILKVVVVAEDSEPGAEEEVETKSTKKPKTKAEKKEVVPSEGPAEYKDEAEPEAVTEDKVEETG
jgi:large subunit ribosomal protein L9